MTAKGKSGPSMAWPTASRALRFFPQRQPATLNTERKDFFQQQQQLFQDESNIPGYERNARA